MFEEHTKHSWHSYPSIYALGHKAVADIFEGDVLVQEKIDGSQFSFGFYPYHDEYPRCRSKGAEITVVAPDKMFSKAVQWVLDNASRLEPGWAYRGEYLAKPKHNTLAYDRVPANNIILFDISVGLQEYLPYEQVAKEAERLGLETVPRFHPEPTAESIRKLLEHVSCLGGQRIEGVVVKNYGRFGADKNVLMAKFVSEAFKEVHGGEWRKNNPGSAGILEQLIAKYKSDARWHKAVQHLRDAGRLEDSPKDISLLFKEVPADILKECKEDIMEDLLRWAWPNIQRGVMNGLPEWYKERLLEQQFNKEGEES